MIRSARTSHSHPIALRHIVHRHIALREVALRRTVTQRPGLRRLAFRHIVALAALFAVGACSRPEPADVVEIVGGTSACNGCRIELGPPLELRSDKPGEDAANISQPAMTIDGQGRFWVAEQNHLARVYDPNGKFLQTIGGKPTGPNEFTSLSAFLPLPGDSMLVFAFDSVQGNRAIVIDSTLHAVRTIRLPGVLMPASADGWPARLLLSGPLTGDSLVIESLHAGSAEQSEFKITKSFGPGRRADGKAETIANYQRVAQSKDSTFWAADILRYRISHFTQDGTLIGTIERTPAWFPTPSPEAIGTPTTAPSPKLFAIWQAPDGLLWVFGRVAGKNWQEGWPKLAPGAQSAPVSAFHFEKLFGTTVEVLDPITRNVVATSTLDEYITNVLPNGNVAVFSVDSAGTRHFSVRRLSLAR